MNFVKSILLTTTVLAVASTTVSAQSYEGTYAGVQIGAAKAKHGKPTSGASNWKSNGVAYKTTEKWALNGGALVGYQHHHSSHVTLGYSLGINMEQAKSLQQTNHAGIFRESKVTRQYVVNLLAKAGYSACGRITPYVTAGAALTKFRFDLSRDHGRNDSNASKTTFGWAGGAGVEYALNHTTDLGVQYLYTWYPSTKKDLNVLNTTYRIHAPKGYHATTLGLRVKI